MFKRKKKKPEKACINCVHVFVCAGDEDAETCLLYDERQLHPDDKKDIDKKIKEAGE